MNVTKKFSKLELEVLSRMITNNKCPWRVRCDICDHFEGDTQTINGKCTILNLEPPIVLMLEERGDLNKQALSVIKNTIL